MHVWIEWIFSDATMISVIKQLFNCKLLRLSFVIRTSRLKSKFLMILWESEFYLLLPDTRPLSTSFSGNVYRYILIEIWPKNIEFKKEISPSLSMYHAKRWADWVIQTNSINRVHFRAITLGKDMKPLYPPSYGLNSTTTVLLGEWLWH